MRFAGSCFAAFGVAAAFALAAPAASAQAPGVPGAGSGNVAMPCSQVNSAPNTGVQGVGVQICGSGMTVVGPSVGRVAVVIGPTITGPGCVGAVGVGAGTVFIGPGAGANNG